MTALHTIIDHLNATLAVAEYEDYCINGLQVESHMHSSVDKICIAVDAGSSVIDQAIAANAKLLIVHHGIFWGNSQAITGTLGAKVEKLLLAGCSLYACHLPLDGNLRFGNAAELARFLDLRDIRPAFPFKGQDIGVIADSKSGISLEKLAELAQKLTGFNHASTFPFGPPLAKKIGIITGSGSDALAECARLGLDTLISGEPKHEAYHAAKELHLNAIFMGHYATETLGVLALGKHLSEKYSVPVEFIDEPTGI